MVIAGKELEQQPGLLENVRVFEAAEPNFRRQPRHQLDSIAPAAACCRESDLLRMPAASDSEAGFRD